MQNIQIQMTMKITMTMTMTMKALQHQGLWQKQPQHNHHTQ